jgi:hypothetical protein
MLMIEQHIAPTIVASSSITTRDDHMALANESLHFYERLKLNSILKSF